MRFMSLCSVAALALSLHGGAFAQANLIGETFLARLLSVNALDAAPHVIMRVEATEPDRVAVGEPFRDGWILSGLTETSATLKRGGEEMVVDLIGWAPKVALTNARAMGQAPQTKEAVGDAIASVTGIDWSERLRQAAANGPEAAANMARFEAAAVPGGRVEIGFAVEAETGRSKPVLIQHGPEGRPLASISVDGTEFEAFRDSPPP